MSFLLCLLVVAVIVRHIVFERGMRRARANGTGIYRYSPAVRRVIVVAVIIVVIVLDTWQWQIDR